MAYQDKSYDNMEAKVHRGRHAVEYKHNIDDSCSDHGHTHNNEQNWQHKNNSGR